jgi:hypothetical protein
MLFPMVGLARRELLPETVVQVATHAIRRGAMKGET